VARPEPVDGPDGRQAGSVPGRQLHHPIFEHAVQSIRLGDVSGTGGGTTRQLVAAILVSARQPGCGSVSCRRGVRRRAAT